MNTDVRDRPLHTEDDTLRRAFRRFRALGLLTIFVFLAFIFLLLFIIKNNSVHVAEVFVLFLLGMTWLGTTALTRHAYVHAFQLTGVHISLPEFLLTQFMVVLFPLYHRKLKRHIRQKDAA